MGEEVPKDDPYYDKKIAIAAANAAAEAAATPTPVAIYQASVAKAEAGRAKDAAENALANKIRRHIKQYRDEAQTAGRKAVEAAQRAPAPVTLGGVQIGFDPKDFQK